MNEFFDKVVFGVALLALVILCSVIRLAMRGIA